MRLGRRGSKRVSGASTSGVNLPKEKVSSHLLTVGRPCGIGLIPDQPACRLVLACPRPPGGARRRTRSEGVRHLSQTQVVASTVEQVLIELGENGSSGCLTVTDPAGEQAEVYFKDGSIYSVFVPGRRAQLGARLIASGDLSPEALASALDVQTNELQGWRLGELLVHLGYVERSVVEAFVVEQLRDAVAALLEWPVAAHKFRKIKEDPTGRRSPYDGARAAV